MSCSTCRFCSMQRWNAGRRSSAANVTAATGPRESWTGTVKPQRIPNCAASSSSAHCGFDRRFAVNSCPHSNGSVRCQRLDDDRVDPLIVFPQIMIGPLDRIVRDEFGRIAPSRRHGQIREAAQIERRTRIGEHGTETLGVAAGGKAVDKRLERTMHAVTPVSYKHSSSARWREAMIREGCFHRGPRRGRFALEAFTQITQRTSAPAVARPARWPAFGRTSSRVLPRPARPLRPHPSDELEF